ncbi:hypothetical protein C0995_010875 [Termitomyces sp. Mi166|nr:hypothetical protein C0995_010875 [Termitomyces sp. Mi166\
MTPDWIMYPSLVYKKVVDKVFSNAKPIFEISVLEAAVKNIVARHENGNKNALMMTNASRGCKTSRTEYVPPASLPFLQGPRKQRTQRQYLGSSLRHQRYAQTLRLHCIGTEPKEEFIGGEWRFNNPTSEVFQEAQNFYGRDRRISCIVNIGAGHPKPIALSKTTDLDKVLGDIATDCENLANRFEKEYGAGNKAKTYFRFNVQQGMQDVGLTEWKKLGEVKTHTTQYLKNAVVNAEIDKIVEVLTGEAHEWDGYTRSVDITRPLGMALRRLPPVLVEVGLYIVTDTATYNKTNMTYLGLVTYLQTAFKPLDSVSRMRSTATP